MKRNIILFILISLFIIIPIYKNSYASNKFLIAHLNVEGQDMIIVPLDNSFGNKTSQQQNQIAQALQICAAFAGIKGTVVPVWMQNNRFFFLAPQPWHSYFQGLSMEFVKQNINRELTCK